MRQCIRLDLDCAAVCDAAAAVLGRAGTPNWALTASLLEACASACGACATECERHADTMAHCKLCAAECRACEAACREALRAGAAKSR